MRNMLFNISRRNYSLVSNAKKLTLPALDFGYDELEPVLSKELLELHHSKHHQAYIDTYNLIAPEFAKAMESGDVKTIETLSKDLNFNAGSHVNHSIYWKNLAPVKNGGGVLPDSSSPLMKKINESYGSADNLISEFSARSLKIHGSGWAWLVHCKKSNTLQFHATKDQDPVYLVSPSFNPLLTIDMWEHSWYAYYKNEKKKYMTNIWKVINWKEVERRFTEETVKF